jgi:hypothetical protein
MQYIYENPVWTFLFIFIIFWGIASCIEAWRTGGKDEQ